ncbi:MAG: UvrD-helicase domain-containing protein [Myxococcota bacterium]|nr:UvrD-helicase domain-containing protein [Myxococcota bacterium]
MNEDRLADQEYTIIEEEQKMLGRVQSELASVISQTVSDTDFDRELIALRDQLQDTHAEDHAMLVEHMTRISALRKVKNREYEAPIDPANPYFARLTLRDQLDGKERVRDVLIGRRAFVDPKHDVQVVDWRNSPISRIYYCYEQGDEYEEAFGGKLQQGLVDLRRTLNVDGGELVRVQAGELIFVKDAHGQWSRLDQNRSRLAGGAGAAIRAPSGRLGRAGADHRLPEITALIDPSQFRAITEPGSGIVVIHGGAGTGKTTIALHRVAYLFFQDQRRYRANRMLVLTPGDGLKRYVSRVLPALDVRGVPIRTFPEWATSTAKRLVPALKKRKTTDETPMGARRLKRHRSLLKLLMEAVRAEAREYDEIFESIGGKPLLNAWVKRRNLPPIKRLYALKKWLKNDAPHVLHQGGIELKRCLENAQGELGDPVETWSSVLTDRAALEAHFHREGVQFYEWELDQLVQTVAMQAEEPGEDPGLGERGIGIDGVSIFAGEIRSKLDADDWSIILRLCQLKYGGLSGPSGTRLSYEHIVVDEAQDLSPLAIKVICESAPPNAPITLAGDTAQRIYFDTGFDDWEKLISDIRVKARILPPLAVSYRSTRQVMELSRHVLGPLASNIDGRDARDGAPVEMIQFDETGQAVAFLADALKSLRSRERRSTVALVARTATVADVYAKALRRAEVPDLRRVHGQDFEFSPGIDITDVFQIKGLEYDYIVLLEPTAKHYPDATEARHLLHVAATRAAHQLWLLTSDTPSPLLPPPLIAHHKRA